jgi:hypothetical protein
MKMPCGTHGAHFPNEFDKTLHWRCTFWKEKGFRYLRKDWKKNIWKWVFSLNSDDLAHNAGYILFFNFGGKRIERFKNQFEEDFPEYKTMNDKEKRVFQKKIFKEQIEKRERYENSFRFKLKKLLHGAIERIV